MKILPAQILLITILFCLLLTQCNWFRKDPQPELPPPTQEGKNTFGCLVNGKPWVPDGNNSTPNREASYGYDQDYGWFVNIRAYRYQDQTKQSMAVQSIGVTGPGEYPLDSPREREGSFVDREKECSYKASNGVYSAGKLIITKLDQTNRIVSGTFEFTVAKAGCDTIRVTDGRFDMPYN